MIVALASSLISLFVPLAELLFFILFHLSLSHCCCSCSSCCRCSTPLLLFASLCCSTSRRCCRSPRCCSTSSRRGPTCATCARRGPTCATCTRRGPTCPPPTVSSLPSLPSTLTTIHGVHSSTCSSHPQHAPILVVLPSSTCSHPGRVPILSVLSSSTCSHFRRVLALPGIGRRASVAYLSDMGQRIDRGPQRAGAGVLARIPGGMWGVAVSVGCPICRASVHSVTRSIQLLSYRLYVAALLCRRPCRRCVEC